MCFNCIASFLSDPIKLVTIGISFILAILLLAVFIKKKAGLSNSKKLLIIYGSFFFFVFPFIFFIYGRTCQNTFLSCNIYKSILYSIPIVFLISVLISFSIVPFIYKFSFKTKNIYPNHYLSKFLETYTCKLKIKKLKLYLIDQAKPLAFSFSQISPRIFISVGLIEILNKKELEAVLLHEIGHITQKSSIFKLTNTFINLLSPVSSFYRFHEELKEEEQKADRFAVKVQNTGKYLHTAKDKIKEFYVKLDAIDKDKKINIYYWRRWIWKKDNFYWCCYQFW